MNDFQYPVNYISITTMYNSSHKALDLGWYSVLHHHQPIYAVADGEVIYYKVQPKGGNCIHIRHKIGDKYFVSEYGHLQNKSIKVVVGQKVKRNQQIAKMGATGVVSAEHLHFGLCEGKTITYTNEDKWLNPVNYLEVYPYQSVKKETIKNYGNKIKYYREIPTKGVYKTLYEMNIRKSPNGEKVKVKDCTDSMKKALTSKTPTANAVVKKGIKFTALSIVEDKGYWAKNYSGYICIQDDKNIYCKKQ